MSPRRSSRARINPPPPPAASRHTASSTSSTSSGRAERSTRSQDKAGSPRRSNPRSQSFDQAAGAAAAAADEPKQQQPPRRTRSGHDDIKEPPIPTPKHEEEDEDVDEEEEEEVTRCVCGQTEYPGLPAPAAELLRQLVKDGEPPVTEDAGNLFIQCDVCKVWQHGGCVGILDDASAPDEYFCEQCRRDLHKVATAPTGQRYSQYLPLQNNSSPASTPQPPARDRASRRVKDSKARPSAETLTQRRRATLNSRDYYDEAEELRRAIEESKKDGGVVGGEGSRQKKRSRSDSEERKVPSKRPRTSSTTASPDSEKVAPVASSSDEALASKMNEHAPKKIRGAAARNHREKELRDQQKERERQEAASKRKSRVDRRRAEDSDPLEDASTLPPPSTISTPPGILDPSSANRSNTKKPSRPAPKNGRRVGRNQYAKDRDNPSSLNQSLNPYPEPAMRTRSRSRSNARDLGSPGHNTNHNGSSRPGTGVNGGGGVGFGDLGSRPSKPKRMNPNRTSMNEMRRRAAAIDDFVARAQDSYHRSNGSGSRSSHDSSPKSNCANEDAGREKMVDGTGEEEGEAPAATAPPTINGVKLDVDFASLSTEEMMANLRARADAWMEENGRYVRA